MDLMSSSWLVMGAMAVLLLLVTFGLRRAATRLERQAERALAAAQQDGEPPGWCYLRPGEPPLGPVGLTTLRAMVADGRLPPEALCAPSGSTQWRAVHSVLAELSGSSAFDFSRGTK